MSDLVERLLESAAARGGMVGGMHTASIEPPDALLKREAAAALTAQDAEIERLRAANKALVEAEGVRDDLAMLLHLLIYRHGKGLPLDRKLALAAQYLARKGLDGSPLRDDSDDAALGGKP